MYIYIYIIYIIYIYIYVILFGWIMIFHHLEQAWKKAIIGVFLY